MSLDQSIPVELVQLSTKDRNDGSFKVSIIGDTLVGKSSIIHRVLGKGFNDSNNPTTGFEFNILGAKINNKILKLQLWDFSGQDIYETITKSMLFNSKLAILVYDISNKETFEHIDIHLKKFKEATQEENIILVGNKSDLKGERKVSTEDGEQKLSLNSDFKKFIECSALSGDNIEEIFKEAARILYEQIGLNSRQSKEYNKNEDLFINETTVEDYSQEIEKEKNKCKKCCCCFE